MVQPLSEQQEATIYQYQLIQRLSIRRELVWSYNAAALIIAAFLLAFYSWAGAASLVAGFFIVPILHFAIVRLTLLRIAGIVRSRRWGWRLGLPFVGYLPGLPIENALFRKTQRHSFWLGFCMIALFYPWGSESLLISLSVWHIWYLAPRLFVSYRLRKQRKDGVVKMDGQEISFYHR
ncbi:hypothetical protein [Paenibacillus beijingensis]|uniref:Uncharacterized protein n=1 Tax=Paenibacillus beijingensis TaxID=1126833 RepID=A0A0D5NHN5_9BACL|nr:hypothetical protein [Paenibacillus beijingensis]AJY74899.1 hypothetical protein VN24_10260 [Paenibacillus beijingensis]